MAGKLYTRFLIQFVVFDPFFLSASKKVIAAGQLLLLQTLLL
jgi:hypothetical protein